MTEAVAAIESLSGRRVVVLAPSSPSVEVLRAQGFTAAETLQQFQVNSELQEKTERQVLWVDEALSKGRTGDGFDKQERVGAIHEIADDASRLAAIAGSKSRRWRLRDPL
jgi:hypothetical protein